MTQYSAIALLLQAQTGIHIGVSWEAVILAFIAAIPPTLLALAAYRQSRKNGADVAVIHTAVNSSATIAAQQLKEARKEIADLRVYIAGQSPAVPNAPLPGRATPDITVDPNDDPDA